MSSCLPLFESLKMVGFKKKRPGIVKRSGIVRPAGYVQLEVDVSREVHREISFDIEQIMVDEVFPDLPRTPPGEAMGSRLRLEFLKRLDEVAYVSASSAGVAPRPHAMC